MVPVPQQLVAFARRVQGSSTGKSDVHALIAKLDTTPDLSKVVFYQFTQVKPPEGKEANLFADVAYDSQRNELVFTCNSLGDFVRVWRIGRHLLLSSVEDTSLRTAGTITRVSVKLDGSIVNVCSNFADKPNASDYKPLISRRGPNGQWSTIPVHPNDSIRQARNSMFVPSVSDLNYVHFANSGDIDNEDGIVSIYQIDKRNFNDLTSNPNITWQHFKVKFIGDPFWDFSTLIVRDKTHDRHRLYYFTSDWSREPDGSILFGYIPLRNDGSVDSKATQLAVPEVTKIPPGPTPASNGGLAAALEYDGKVVLVIEIDNGKHQILSGQIADDGSLPAGQDWKRAIVEYGPMFDGVQFAAAASCYALVPGDFI